MEIITELDPIVFLSSGNENEEHENDLVPSFFDDISYGCLTNCGFCCSYKVPLFQKDIERLQRHTNRHFLSRDKQTGNHLTRSNGSCIFLQKNKRCNVYTFRPAYCHIYPLVPQLYGGGYVDIDLSCPGTRIETNSEKPFIKELKYLESTSIFESYLQSHPQQKADSIILMLKNRGAFTKPSLLKYTVARLIQNTFKSKRKFKTEVELFHAKVERIKKSLRNAGNIDSRDQVEKILESSSNIKKVGGYYWTKKRLGSHFSNWKQNTKVNTDQKETTVNTYQFRFNFRKAKFEFSGSVPSINWSKLHGLETEWSLDAKKLLIHYLTIWLKRKFSLHFAQVSTIQTPQTYNILSSYLNLFRDISARISLLGNLFASRDNRVIIGPEEVAESIRATDNIFR